MFGDDYYLEYQSHADSTQQQLNRQIVNLANEVGVKYVVTCDSHYLNREDQKYHSIFVQIGQSREVEKRIMIVMSKVKKKFITYVKVQQRMKMK